MFMHKKLEFMGLELRLGLVLGLGLVVAAAYWALV